VKVKLSVDELIGNIDGIELPSFESGGQPCDVGELGFKLGKFGIDDVVVNYNNLLDWVGIF
jgi:hypothetical protein